MSSPNPHPDLPRRLIFFRPPGLAYVRRVARQELRHLVVGRFHGIEVRLGVEDPRAVAGEPWWNCVKYMDKSCEEYLYIYIYIWDDDLV